MSGQRADIIGWVNQGGGELVEDQIQRDVHFTIECHGAVPSQTDAARVTYVSSHWVKSCLEVINLFGTESEIPNYYGNPSSSQCVLLSHWFMSCLEVI